MTEDSGKLLETNLTVSYGNGTPVLRDLQLQIGQGELVGLAGQSGSGKSTLALALMGFLDKRRAQVRGRIRFRGRDLMGLKEKEWRSIRGREITFVVQSAASSLTPTMRLGAQIREAWQVHSAEAGRWKEEAARALRAVSLPSDDGFLRLYPNELSVGMAQRFLTAMAVLHKPALLIADEPTSALDVITQRELLELLRSLNSGHGTAILLITHDLMAAAGFCHRLAVLHEGEIVEQGCAEEIMGRPAHPYTKRLVSAIPRWAAESHLPHTSLPRR